MGRPRFRLDCPNLLGSSSRLHPLPLLGELGGALPLGRLALLDRLVELSVLPRHDHARHLLVVGLVLLARGRGASASASLRPGSPLFSRCNEQYD